jgi:alanine dehydrogenase
LLIGVPREIKDHEYRVAVTPEGVQALVAAGHRVRVEQAAGRRVGLTDEAYRAAGARIVSAPADVYASDMVVKVKELQASELALLRPGLIVFGYHHFAADPPLIEAVIDAGITCIGYETVTDARGKLPLLVPMSEIAGRLAPQVGAWALQMANGGSGVLLSGARGVSPAEVLIIGGGVVGQEAAAIALGMGAAVTLLDRDSARLGELERKFGARLAARRTDAGTLEPLIAAADLVIVSVHVPGKHAPKVVSRSAIRSMREGSVLVDVAIDQGGGAETSRPTSHSAPLYLEEGVVHYCVPNMPAAVARTATFALTRATLPYVLALAQRGVRAAALADSGLARGVQVHAGTVTHAGLAQDTGRPCREPLEALG